MDQPKRIVHLEQRFCTSQEKVAAGQQIRIKMLHYATLRSQVEVDQHIAAENDVHPFLEQHLGVVTEVDAVKADLRFEQVVGLELLVANIFEVFPAQQVVGTAQGILSVNSGACRFQRIIVQIGGENLEGPTGKQLVFFFEQKHGQRVGLFSGRAAGAPEANPFKAERTFGLQDLGKNHVAQRIQLGGVTEHVGFADGDFIQQQAQLRVAISARSEVFQVLRRAGHAECDHPAPAAPDQKIKLLLGMIDSRDPVNHIAEKLYLLIGRC